MSTAIATRKAGASEILEIRTRPLDVAGAEIRADDNGSKRFDGHAAVFEVRTSIGDPYRWGWFEEIGRSAFDKTLAEGDARFLVDHNTSLLVARKSAGDLRLSTDSVGLAVDSDLDDELSYVRDLVRNLEKRRITGMSFGFYVVRDTWRTEQVETSDGGTVDVEVRTIDEVRLLEVSAVTFPAYEDTDAGLRSRCSEIRAARHPQTSEPVAPGTETAPPDEGTRSDDTAPAEKATRSSRLDERAHALAIRYRLPMPDTQKERKP